MCALDEDSIFSNNKLNELIAEYLQAIQVGEIPDRSQMLADNPILAEDLKSFFEDHDWMHRLAGAPGIPFEENELDDSPLSMVSTVIGSPAERIPPPTTRGAEALGTLGGYELLEEIGRGGMGVIYKAHQRSLNRLVALKMIRSSHLASQEEVDRFRSEAELAAGLEHPGIVPIYEVGEAAGQYFYSMPLVDGMSLGELLLQVQVLPPQTSAELLCRVAEAIDYAHRRGVIHRDLKPANILLAGSPTQSGVLVNIEGTIKNCDPKVTDFGLAKRVESDSALTGTGQILGTPSYMSPEQAGGNVIEVGPLSDVYSLGAVLYCLLAGHPPFRAANVLETLQQVMQDEPVAPRQLNSAIPKDLETICLKCLHKNPARRYASAWELASDLRRFLKGEAVTARPTSGWERMWKWVKRRPTTATLVLVVLVATMAVVGLGVSYFYQIEREQLLYSRSTLLTHQLWKNGDLERAQKLLAICPEHQRGWEWEYLHRLTRTGVVQTLDGNKSDNIGVGYAMYRNQGTAIAYDPQGRFIAAPVGSGPVLIWDAATGLVFAKLTGHTAKVQGIAFSATGEMLASAGREGIIKLWDVRSRKVLHDLSGHEGIVECVAFSPDGSRLASGGIDGTIRLWDLPAGTPGIISRIGEIEAHDIEYSPDGRTIAAAFSNGKVGLFNADDLSFIRNLSRHSHDVRVVSYHPNGRLLASAGEDGRICLWDPLKGRETVFCEGHKTGVVGLAFSPDGSRLASSGKHDKTVRIWDPLTGGLLLSMNVEAKPGTNVRDFGHIAYHPGGRFVAVASDDNLVRVWSLGISDEFLSLQAHTSPVRSVVFGPDGLMATADEEGVIRLWHPSKDEFIREIKAHGASISALAFSPDGKKIASGSSDQSIKVWNVANGRELWSRREHKGAVYSVSFSPQGGQLASAGHDGQILFWDSDTGQRTQSIVHKTHFGETSPVSSVVFSPDGNQLAIGGWDGVVALYKVMTQDLVAEEVLRGHQREVWCVCFSRDGSYLASGDRDGKIIVWDSDRGRAIARLPAHTGSVTGIVFSSRGNRLISTGWDGGVNVWNIDSGQETLTLNSHHGRSYCVMLDPEDTILVSGNHDGTVTLWGR